LHREYGRIDAAKLLLLLRPFCAKQIDTFNHLDLDWNRLHYALSCINTNNTNEIGVPLMKIKECFHQKRLESNLGWDHTHGRLLQGRFFPLRFFFGRDRIDSMTVASTATFPFVTMTAFRSNWLLLSAKIFSCTPTWCSCWRKFQMVEWSGVFSSKPKPVNRRNNGSCARRASISVSLTPRL